MGRGITMGYKKDLENASSIEECQKIYDDYVRNKYKMLCKQEDSDVAMNKMICKDFGYWQQAEHRASEIAGYSSFEPFIISRF